MRWTDHKTVGLQYGLTGLGFLLIGFLLMMLMRWQLAWPGQPLPAWLTALLGEVNAPGGIMLAWTTRNTPPFDSAHGKAAGVPPVEVRINAE